MMSTSIATSSCRCEFEALRLHAYERDLRSISVRQNHNDLLRATADNHQLCSTSGKVIGPAFRRISEDFVVELNIHYRVLATRAFHHLSLALHTIAIELQNLIWLVSGKVCSGRQAMRLSAVDQGDGSATIRMLAGNRFGVRSNASGVATIKLCRWRLSETKCRGEQPTNHAYVADSHGNFSP